MRESEPDNRIEASAGRSCVHRNCAKDDDIRIHARRGTAALIGTVAEQSRKTLAEDTVEGLPASRRRQESGQSPR